MSSLKIVPNQSVQRPPLISNFSPFNEPPSVKSSSTIITLAPVLAAINAEYNPEGPAPMTNKSQCKKPLSYILGSGSLDSLPNPAAFR